MNGGALQSFEFGPEDFRELLRQTLARGVPLRFAAAGASMDPFIKDGDVLTVSPLPPRLSPGDIVAAVSPANGLVVVHRAVGLRGGAVLRPGPGRRPAGTGHPRGTRRPAGDAGHRAVAAGHRPAVAHQSAAARCPHRGGRQAPGAAMRTAAKRTAGRPVRLHPQLRSIKLPDLPLWHRARETRVPLAFELELTARCDNNCRHCYINLPAADASARARELTAAEIDGLARQAAALGSLWCLVTGGEPLLRPDFEEVYLALKRRGLLVSVFTNACLVDDRIVRLFQHYPPRDLEVTVYGVSRATYEAVTRVPGSFGRFIAGLGRLEQAGIRPRLKAMALRSNLHELPRIAAFCRRHTRDYFRFDPQLHLRYDRDRSRNREIAAQRLSPAEVVAVERADRSRRRALQRNCERLLPRGNGGRGLFFCRAGLDSFTIGWDGSFKLCGALTDPACTCDLRNGTLQEAWSTFAPTVRNKRPRDGRFKNACGACDLINLCLWCPAHAYLETGARDEPVDGFCEMATARQRLIRP
ncbi:MAG: radical SAM protein [Candidatus Edwardsbacteria bacterium]|nr:radical SAM protein [Candidatus Edwardsbacteria bacterium]